MAIIRQLKNWFTKQNIYPQTVEQAIYDANGVRLDNKISNGLSNPNLLINTDFSNLINQRGYISGTEIANYCVDRWVVSGAMYDRDGYITIVTGENNLGYIVQRLEFPNKYKGKKLTLSIKYRSYNDNCYLGMFGITDADEEKIFFTRLPNTNGNWNIHHVTIECENIDYSQLEYCVYIGYQINTTDTWISNEWSGTNIEVSIDIAWTKMEEGEIATPFRPRLYVEELALCQRYFYRMKPTDMYIYTMAIIQDINTAYAPTDLPVNMRVCPNLVVSGYGVIGSADDCPSVYGYNGGQHWDNITNISIASNDCRYPLLRCNLANQYGMIPGEPVFFRLVGDCYIDFDAEL